MPRAVVEKEQWCYRATVRLNKPFDNVTAFLRIVTRYAAEIGGAITSIVESEERAAREIVVGIDAGEVEATVALVALSIVRLELCGPRATVDVLAGKLLDMFM